MEDFIREDGRLDIKAIFSVIFPVLWDKLKTWAWEVYLSPLSVFINDLINTIFEN